MWFIAFITAKQHQHAFPQVHIYGKIIMLFTIIPCIGPPCQQGKLSFTQHMIVLYFSNGEDSFAIRFFSFLLNSYPSPFSLTFSQYAEHLISELHLLDLHWVTTDVCS